MGETKTITVVSTWESTQTFTVPSDTDTSNVNELAQLMHLVRLDPDGDGDLTSVPAELVDWEVSG